MRKVKISSLTFGNGKVYIQSMTNTKTSDATETIKQILSLEQAGCEIVRVSVPNEQSANAIGEIRKNIHIPLVADIHFDHKLAILAAKNGADKIRINPGNIGSKEKIKELVDVCKEKRIPIRIGVNGGSLDDDIVKRFGKSSEALVESARKHLQILNDLDFFDIVLSIKSSNVLETIKANRLLHKTFDYPIHLGLTEAGTKQSGSIKNSIAIGSLLCDNIGDTIRVSLSGNPVEEVYIAKKILQSIGLDRNYVEVIACPTCARCDLEVERIATVLENRYSHINKHLVVAVMGCIVNGIGEGKNADIGIAGGKTSSIIFKNGEKLCTVNNEFALGVLMDEIDDLLNEG